MPKRGSREWLSKVGIGLTSGALALSVLSWGGNALPAPGARAVQAEDIDCYNDKDLYNLAECVERRAIDARTGNSQNESQGASTQPGGSTEQQAGGGGQPAGGGQPPSGGGDQQAGGGQPPAGGGGGQQPAASNSQPAAEEDDEDKPEPPRGPLTGDPDHCRRRQGSHSVHRRRGVRQVRQVRAEPLRA